MLRRIFERARRLQMGDRELGELSGYSTTSIYYYRTGRRHKAGPRLQAIMDWAQAVGLELTVTLEDKG